MDIDNIDKVCIKNNKIIFYKKNITVPSASILGTIDGHFSVDGNRIVNVATPKIVHTDHNGYKSISYTELIPMLIAYVKELKNKIDSK